jgi:hypothetical protein
MKQRLVYGFLFFLLGIFGAINAQFYSVSGTVTDNINTKLGDVRIYSDAPFDDETYTDNAGIYLFDSVPYGTLVTLHAEKAGYTFTPETIERTVNSELTGLHFTGIASKGGAATIPVTFYYETNVRSVTDVFIAGSMNDYNPNNHDYKLSLKSEGLFSITLNLAADEYVYKFVANGNWENDPYNPDKDGSEYNNSKIYVSDPMITYFLPAFNENYSSTNMPHLTAYVASSVTQIDLSNFSLEINGNPAETTPAYDTDEKKLTYTPAQEELTEGENICKLTFTVDGVGVSKTIHFQYSSDNGGGDGNTFTVTGTIIEMPEGNPIEGVKISNGSDITFTNTQGYYSLAGCNSDMSIVPSKEGYIFEPGEISLLDYNSDVPYANFDAMAVEIIPYTISGSVTICGNPAEGIQVESRDKIVYTAPDGTYSLTDTVIKNVVIPEMYYPVSAEVAITGGNYASGDYFGSLPQRIEFHGATNYTDINFSGVNAVDSITGNVSHMNDTPFANLALNWQIVEERDPSQIVIDSTIYTDASGNYVVPFIYTSTYDGSGISYIYNIEPLDNEYSFNTSITVNSSYSCEALRNNDIVASYTPVPICMVSVSENNNNIVVWEKPVSEEITRFDIYRESDVANEYEYIDSVSYDNIAIYTDLTSNPSQKAYRYKISTNVKHGYDVMSNLHKTIHLTINKGTGNNWNLIWSHYEGLSISTYRLYRGIDENNMEFLADIAGTLNSYTDEAPSTDEFFYQIEMVIPEACDPEVAKPILKGLTSEKSYTSTKSNVVSTTISSERISDITADMGWIYPNPVKNTLYLNNVIGLSGYEIFSIHGILIHQGQGNSTIDVSDLQTGLYYLRIYSPNQWSVYKFIKE